MNRKTSIRLSELETPSERYPPAPSEIIFPNGDTLNIDYWKDLLTAATEWLNRKGYLTESHCPIMSGYRNYIVSTTPYHSSGKEFKEPQQVGNLWVETFVDTLQSIQRTRTIIEYAGLDPAQFKVRLP